ncbi:MAG: TfoX/Sxy family protein [Gemmatimonadota bacterium]
MPVSASFRDFVLDQMKRAVRGIRARSMFGGVGIYAGELFFALIADDTLYFKVDDSNRPDFVALGMGPFLPYGDERDKMSYYEVPADLLDDPDALRPWAEKSIAVAAQAAKQKSKRPRKR